MRQKDMPPQNGCPCEIDYIGELELTLPENVMLVESDRDYVQACGKLAKQFGAKEALKMWVRNRNHFFWLNDFVKQIDLECLFQEKTVREVLADRWNVSLPDWLSSEDCEHGIHFALLLGQHKKGRSKFIEPSSVSISYMELVYSPNIEFT